MVYNPRYDKARWKRFHDQVGHMRNIIKRAKASRLNLPLSPRDALKEACYSHHINDLSNAQCGRAGYHHPYPVRRYQALI